jgi:hypothetical protein
MTSKNLLIEDETVEEQLEIEDPIFYEGHDKEILYRDGNETLVVKKCLLAPKYDSKEDWLMSNIFHTTCTIAEQVCKFIRGCS